MKTVLLYIPLILLAVATQAQPLTLLYELKPDSVGNEDTLSISLRNNTPATLDLGAVNFSVAYQGSCAGLFLYVGESVLDPTDRIIYQTNQVQLSGTQVKQLDVSEYAPGIYMVRIQEQDDKQYYSQSFLKKTGQEIQ